uniref:Uncharacterized protein n=1 Tax=Skeletonema marinoi TaxID=267567 RepID=A0A7S2LQ00_9STRA|mmetsp:Transcript_27395/g.46364  ORF Transcript_27395/g.46364 Transcript_27395/m.46364 type:complete len:437 (+) Transcript_27395:70-1380(+)
MQSRRAFPLLLLAAFSVTAANAFIPRRQRRYLTEASRPSIGSSSQSLHKRDATLPFGLQLRGGDADGDVASEVENGEETIDDKAADSDQAANKVWEEEIKRTQSFYQEQSASDASESVDDGANNDEDMNSEASAAQSDTTVDVIEGDDIEPAQANEDIVDAVEGEADAEENDTVEVDAVDDVSDEALQEATEEEVVAENEAQDEVSEEEEVAEALQVEVVTEEQTSDCGEVGNVDAEEVIASEEADITDIVEESVAKEEGEEVAEGVIAEEDVLEGDTVGGEEQSTADEENAGSDGVADSSVTPLGDAGDDGVSEGDADAADDDESSESTPEQDASSVAVTDEPTSLVRKVSAVVQVMLLRGRIAVSKNKGVQYLAQNKPKIKVIALASLGGVLSLLVGGHVFLAMQETDALELPNDEWIEEESYVDEADEDDNDY